MNIILHDQNLFKKILRNDAHTCIHQQITAGKVNHKNLNVATVAELIVS